MIPVTITIAAWPRLSLFSLPLKRRQHAEKHTPCHRLASSHCQASSQSLSRSWIIYSPLSQIQITVCCLINLLIWWTEEECGVCKYGPQVAARRSMRVSACTSCSLRPRKEMEGSWARSHQPCYCRLCISCPAQVFHFIVWAIVLLM